MKALGPPHLDPDCPLAPGLTASLYPVKAKAQPGWARIWVRKISKIGKISKILQIFGGLVLGCIKTKFCKKICV